MSFIYNLDQEGGGSIIGDSGTTGPSLTISNFGVGGAVLLTSCASGNPIVVQAKAKTSRFESVDGGVAPALDVNSYAAGYPAIQVASTASGYPIDITAINETYGVRFRSTATPGVALIVGKTVTGSPTIAPIKILHPSCASAAVLEVGGGFISCTSVDFVATAETDYVLPISLNGVIRGIPLVQLSAIQGGATFA